jgi:lipopolysaccharide/colanic/teichoic acid biosynthesis glycosyltransferase
MRVWPILLDSEHAYLGSFAHGSSLLMAPLGVRPLISEVCRRVAAATSKTPIVFAPHGTSADYRARVRATCPSAVVVTTSDELADTLSAAEVSDGILLVDPRCFPVDGAQIASLMVRASVRPQVARHLVAYRPDVAGTKEHVNVDCQGLVRSVHRYYKPATWPFIAGVAASLVPVSSGVLPLRPMAASLVELRQQLASRGVPSRDMSLEGGAYDLTEEPGLLTAVERYVLEAADEASTSRGTSTVFVGSGQDVHASARLLGPIVVYPNARIDERATIVGPALLGERSRVSAGAVVAHSVLGAGSLVPKDRVLRDRVWTDTAHRATGVTEGRVPSYTERLARVTVETHEQARIRALEDTAGRRYLAWKPTLDAMGAAIGLALLSPLLVLAAALVRLESKGPVFYRDEREGVAGRLFKCLKFRTMRIGANNLQHQLKDLDKLDGPHFKLESDPRITRVGRYLRATNIDELPQLVNVLLGDMSLVGPRPSPFRENQICVPWREGRLSVRPGITGLWQVCRQDRESGDFHQWIEYDLLYVQYLSPLLDLKIVAATILTLGGNIPVPVSWMVRIPRRPPQVAGAAPDLTHNRRHVLGLVRHAETSARSAP